LLQRGRAPRHTASVEIIGVKQPVELIVVGFQDMAFTISGRQWQSDFHTCTELDSFAKDYTTKSGCTVILDYDEHVTIGLGAMPSQHKYYSKYYSKTPLKEFVITITSSPLRKLPQERSMEGKWISGRAEKPIDPVQW
jgi:hypothetical protein